jgi:CRP-like cAMP-binding protein
MLSPNSGGPLDNKLLSILPRSELEILLPHLSSRDLPQGRMLLESDEEFDQVYFPHSGMLSLLVVMLDGKAIETSTVGREGVVGAMAGIGLYKSSARVVVQLAMTCTVIAASQFRKAVAANEVIRKLCIDYNEVLLMQSRVTAGCNALHPIDQRFCRWLLQSSDRAASDTVELTQEFLSEMLGVRRTSVTEVAGNLQKAGVITYARGIIRILDRKKIEDLSCECFRRLSADAS